MNKKKIESQKIKKPWPTKDAMEQIYEMRLWGDNRYTVVLSQSMLPFQSHL